MTTLKLDSDHDVAIVSNAPVLVSGADEVLQRLKNRLKTFEGEWFLDTRIGLPFYREIFVKNPRGDRVASYIKREIINTPGVLELLEYTQTIGTSARTLTVSFKVLATDGAIIEHSEGLAA